MVIALEQPSLLQSGSPSIRVSGTPTIVAPRPLLVQSYISSQLGDGSHQSSPAIDFVGTNGSFGLGTDQAAAIPYRDFAIYKWISNRSVSDAAVTQGSAVLTSATAAFTVGDIGRVVRGQGIPAWTTIIGVTNGTTAVLSVAATITGSSLYLEIAETGNPVRDEFYLTGHGEHATTFSIGGSYTDQTYRLQVVGGAAVAGVNDTAMGTLQVVGGQNSTGFVLHTRTYADSGKYLTVNADGSTTITDPLFPTYAAWGTTPAASGAIRLPNNTSIFWRNAANTADVGFTMTSSPNLALTLGGLGNSFYPSQDADYDFGGATFRWRNMFQVGYHHMSKITAPGNAASSAGRLYVQDNGLGKMQLCVIFPTGAAFVLATEA